jgi:hypothetical protein
MHTLHGEPEKMPANVISFHKTNGQSTNSMGVPLYEMWFDAELEFTQDCEFDPKQIWSWEWSNNVHPDPNDVKKGEHRKVSGSVSLNKTENGWLLVGTH